MYQLKLQNQKSAPTTTDELAELLAGDHDMVTVTISPELAQGVLDAWRQAPTVATSGTNRKLQKAKVAKFAKDQRAGDFEDGREIIFGVFDDGTVLLGDGQHRLSAQVQSGATASYCATIARTRDHFNQLVTKVVDQGGARSSADIISIDGEVPLPHSPLAASILVAMVRFAGFGNQLTHSERIRYFKQHGSEIRHVLELVTATRPMRFRAHVLAALAFAYRKFPEATDLLIEAVMGSGAEMADGIELEFRNAVPLFNQSKQAKSKDRDMGRVLRVIYDAHEDLQSNGRNGVYKIAGDRRAIRVGIEAVLGQEIADAWAKRNSRKPRKSDKETA